MKVIDFHAQWCGPCRVFGPIFEKVSQRDDMKDIIFTKADAENENDEELFVEYGVKNIPTIVIANSETGELITKLVGLQSEDSLVSAILDAKEK